MSEDRKTKLIENAVFRAYETSEDGSIGIDEIATSLQTEEPDLFQHVGLPAVRNMVSKHHMRLKEEGYILPIQRRINYKKICEYNIDYLYVVLADPKSLTLNDCVTHLTELDYVFEVAQLIGDYDLLIKFISFGDWDYIRKVEELSRNNWFRKTSHHRKMPAIFKDRPLLSVVNQQLNR